MAEKLSRKHHVLVPDLLGFGRSDKPVAFEDLWVNAQVDAIMTALDDRQVDRFLLVGHDFGGPIAVKMAHDHPERVQGLLLSACNVFEDPPLQLPMRLLPTPVVGDVIESMLFSSFALKMMGRSGSQGQAPSVNPADEVQAIRTIFATALRKVPHHFGPIEKMLPLLKINTLVVWGAKDPFFPIQHAQRIVDTLPNSRLSVYDNVGHFPHIEAAERLVRDIEVMQPEPMAGQLVKTQLA